MYRFQPFSKGLSLVLLILALNSTVLNAQNSQGYQRPNEVIAKLIDAPSTPSVSIDSKAKWMLLMERPGYPTIAEVAAPELRIAGTRINPATNGRSRSSHLTGIKLKDIANGEEYTFTGMPSKPQIGNVNWSNNEAKIAFTKGLSFSASIGE